MNLENLDLYKNYFTRYITTELGELKLLMCLLLNVNMLEGLVPTDLGKVSFLANINLCHNGLFGVIPDEVCFLIDSETLLMLSLDCHSMDVECPYCYCYCCDVFCYPKDEGAYR